MIPFLATTKRKRPGLIAENSGRRAGEAIFGGALTNLLARNPACQSGLFTKTWTKQRCPAFRRGICELINRVFGTLSLAARSMGFRPLNPDHKNQYHIPGFIQQGS